MMPRIATNHPGRLRGTVALACLTACSREPASHSEVAEQVAEHLCVVQDSCGCDPEVLIDDCTRRVAREVTHNEQRALDAGLILDEDCLQLYLTDVDGLASCGPDATWASRDCTVYYGTAGVGDPCMSYELYPPMVNCQQGLECRAGTCYDLDNLPPLQEGERCSDAQNGITIGLLGRCAQGLACDTRDTETCIPYGPTVPVPLGGECPEFGYCEPGTYCRPPEGNEEASEEAPGICTNPTPPGDPCTLAYECDRFCIDGFCEELPPSLCKVIDDWTSARAIIEQEAAT